MAHWRLSGLALIILVAAQAPASAENLLAKPAVKMLLEGLGASPDDSRMLTGLVERYSKPGTPELSPKAKRIAGTAEAEYQKRCPAKNPWEVFRRRPDPPPGASDTEVTCAFLHNLHVEMLKLALKIPK